MTEFEKLILEKLDNMQDDISTMRGGISTLQDDVSTMQSDIVALKKTAIKTETELIPKTQLMLDNYMSIAEKVNISDDLKEEVKTLRYEVDLIKQILQNK